jgi:hypothetical protein
MNWTTACKDWESMMSAAMKGRKKTDEHRAKLSAALMGRQQESRR